MVNLIIWLIIFATGGACAYGAARTDWFGKDMTANNRWRIVILGIYLTIIGGTFFFDAVLLVTGYYH